MVASFTILTTSLVVDVSRRNNITWDCLISCEMSGIYKPRPEAYQTAAKWLALAPHEILMVACHNFDLMAARAVGYHSAFVRRPMEWGPSGPLIRRPIQRMTLSSTLSSIWPSSSVFEHCQTSSVARQWHACQDIPK